MNIRQFSTIAMLALAALSAVSCNKEKIVEPEVSVFELCFTEYTGMTYSSSEFLYWMEREDFSPTVYAEGGRVWVKGSEDLKSVQDCFDECIANCNEKLKDLGEFSSVKYTPSWNPDAGTKVTDLPSLNDIEFTDAELQELKKQLVNIPPKYPKSIINEIFVEKFFDILCEKARPVTVRKALFFGVTFFTVVPYFRIFFISKFEGDGYIQDLKCAGELTDALLEFCLAKYLGSQIVSDVY